MIATVILFGATYVAISARRLGWLRLDRAGAALSGAAAAVAIGALSPRQAVHAVDGETLILLFGMMGVGAVLGSDGFFERAADALSQRAQTPARLLAMLIWSSGALAALITNDAVCVLAAPLVVNLVERHRLPRLPFLLGLASAANTGSVATLVGNPQNMLCANLGGLAYRDHLLLMGPVAAIGLGINHFLLYALFRRELRAATLVPQEAREATRVITPKSAVALAVVAASAVLYTLGTNLAWTATGACAVLVVALRVDPDAVWKRIDWSVLLFFAGLFVVVDALVKSGAPAWVFAHYPLGGGRGAMDQLRLSAIFTLGSNVVSNVPFILVVRDQMATLANSRIGWELLAMSSTFAGNLTLIGSVANVIVAERGRAVGGIGFFEHLRLGVPLTVLTVLAGTAWVTLAG